MDSALEWRGGQRQVEYLAKGMAARGLQVRVATPPGSELSRRLGPLAVPVPSGTSLSAILALRRWMADFQPHVVAAHTPHAHGLCLAAGVRPVVHRRVDFRLRTGLHHRLKYAGARGWVAVSQAVKRILEEGGVSGDRVRVVLDGVEPLPPAPPDPDLGGPGPLIGAVGALVAHKGHRHLVAAMTHLEGVRCVIAGQGPLEEELRRQIQDLGLAGRVRLLGHRADVASVLASLDLLVHPSVEEGLGQVVVEALLMGLPVVASRAGGLPEVVEARHLFPPADPLALGEAVRRRLQEPGDPAPVRDRVLERFSVGRMVEETMRAYMEFQSQEPPA